ncbi:class I SAM-dependent methyltransferase [Sphaerospermopsis torques-reginae]|uniref:Class I SAM-dependent methyltransferase n=1 Tax=Sphaerospermopsis torques-reginae ITEP-024 TaxID=984208 RepID=A0ABX8WU31_9CYAN|nr:methyltransferase domain-containing protein [Sphaerospermopsis torques-reginae]QYX29912.1 class I SAM-dependent methyltransferase [Sphaerospermopsis torques-reginae ITEP-024]
MRIEKLLKKNLLSFINKAGFQVRRFSDPLQLPLYESLFDSVILASKPFYNVGSGSFCHPLWTNIDYVSGWYGQVQKKIVHHDLMSETPLPIESNSAEIVYTSHTIEHIKDRAVLYFFRDTYRALKPGGIFRVTTGPDAETDFRASFSNIYRSGYGQSVSPILRNTQLFDSTHPQMSIYMECIK